MWKIRYDSGLLQDDFFICLSIFLFECTEENYYSMPVYKILCFQQDFCKLTNWPPLSELKMIVGGEGEACVDTCLEKQLTCEPKFFTSLNTKETFER